MRISDGEVKIKIGLAEKDGILEPQTAPFTFIKIEKDGKHLPFRHSSSVLMKYTVRANWSFL